MSNASEAKAAKGYRGYIASRAVRGTEWPQHVQNLVIRDYCQRNGKQFLLSATEYAMPACYMMLETVMEELPELDGVVFFSLFMLPKKRERRMEIYQRIFDAGCTLHGAFENLSLNGPEDIERLEDIFLVDQVTAKAGHTVG